jgi:hypothetical protein
VAAAIAYASHRQGTIAFAVRTQSGAWGWHASRTFPSASVLIRVALLTRGDERVSVAILTHLDGSHAYGKGDAGRDRERLLGVLTAGR